MGYWQASGLASRRLIDSLLDGFQVECRTQTLNTSKDEGTFIPKCCSKDFFASWCFCQHLGQEFPSFMEVMIVSSFNFLLRCISSRKAPTRGSVSGSINPQILLSVIGGLELVAQKKCTPRPTPGQPTNQTSCMPIIIAN